MIKPLLYFAMLFMFGFSGINIAYSANDAPSYKLVDTGVITHSDGYSAYDLVFDIDQLPEGGLGGDVMQRDMSVLCQTWAHHLIPNITAKLGKPEKASFVAVTVKSGTDVLGVKAGRYFRVFFDTDGKHCFGKSK